MTKIRYFIQKHESVDVFILVISQVLAYGLLIPFLHYYIDDMYWVWTWNTFGHPGITHHFERNRPIVGLLYQLTLPVLAIHPIVAHLFALSMRIAATLMFYFLLKKLWPQKRRVLLVAAIIFGLYPGFSLQSIAITYSHIFLTLSCFLASLYLTINWITTKSLKDLIFSLLLSLFNLLIMEYFFTLEFIRIIIIWMMFNRLGESGRTSIRKTLIHFIPYFLLVISTIVFRFTVLTEIQTYRYPITFFSDFLDAPINTMVALMTTIAKDFYITTIGAWEPAIRNLLSLTSPNRIAILSMVLSVLFSICMVVYLLIIQKPGELDKKKKTDWHILLVGFFGFFFAGWPYWLTSIEVTQFYLDSRFTITFLFGAAILLAFIYLLISENKLLSSIFVFLLVFPSLYYQIQTMNDFRNEWKQNRVLTWEIHWRIPDLQENTLVLITDYPNQYYDVSSLATELAMMFPKPSSDYSLPYFMLYSRNVHENNHGLKRDIPIEGTNLTAKFSGNTSQLIAAQYEPGICFRILDPEIDGADNRLPGYLQSAAALSDCSLIQQTPVDIDSMRYFGKEPNEQWCYYFEKADLAKQQKNWVEVAHLYDTAKQHGYRFNTDREKYIFIESFAYLGRWDDINEITNSMMLDDVKDGLCVLANRINQDVPDSDGKLQYLTNLQDQIPCKID